MFHIKEKINGAVEITVEINDENVFCTCPGCGKEVRVDLADVFRDGEGDLSNTAVHCKECSKSIWEEKNERK